MGGTAPDMIEIGNAPQPVLIGCLGRFFVHPRA
jgi:hypothetical protein